MCCLLLERLVDIEEESSLSALAETIVETHVDVLLEFPSIAHTKVGQDVTASHLAELGEDGSCTYPGRERVAFPSAARFAGY